MSEYKLLTPGPLSTSETVKQAMLEDVCTWDASYKSITQEVRAQLLRVAEVTSEKYTTVLMQGSGSFVVESVLTTVVKSTDKVLLLTNGAYGNRMVQMAEKLGLQHTVYSVDFSEVPHATVVKNLLQEDQKITHIAMVHCETTTGILNPIEPIGAIAKQYGKTFIVDAMSSFGGVPMDVERIDVDFLISSANKCIEGVPGFGFVICKRIELEKCAHHAQSVALDLYEQWQGMDGDGKWRFTSPTHAMLAFRQALKELEEEGGVITRYKRYHENNRFVRNELESIGVKAYIPEAYQSPIISTFLFPSEAFDFELFYEKMKEEGFVIYPGKLTEVDTFRIGNIGQVFREDFEQLCALIKNYMRMEVFHGQNGRCYI